MSVVVTGGAGFVGSNLVRGLNASGVTDVVVVDDLTRGDKFHNLADLTIADFVDKREFLELVGRRALSPRPDVILHQGACTNTMAGDGRYMMENNYRYSRVLLDYALGARVPFVYASSAAVYGASRRFAEEPATSDRSTCTGTRSCCSTSTSGSLLPERRAPWWSCGTSTSTPPRAALFLAQGPVRTGIVNLGTGGSRSFNDVARALIACHGAGAIRYEPLPEGLEARYQSFTEADMRGLRALGYADPFVPLEEGARRYYADITAASRAGGGQ